MKNKVRIEVDAELWRWVKTEAVSTGRTTSEVVEILLNFAKMKGTKVPHVESKQA